MNRILMACAALVISASIPAQEAWPAKPVRFIVPSSPGGGTVVYARILAQALGVQTFADAGFPLEVITSFSVVAPAGTPAQFAASLKKERDGWATFIRRNGIEADQ